MPGELPLTFSLTSPVDKPEHPLQSVSSPTIAQRFRRRVHGWTWQAFPIGMGTGAAYVTMSSITPHPQALTYFEFSLFILNLIIFSTNCTMLFLQAILYPRQFVRIICDPNKGFFVPLFVLSFATIIIGVINYLHPSMTTTLVLFWIYVSLAIVLSTTMLMVWFNRPHDISKFTPAYAFLIFPMMLIGVIAMNVLKVIPDEDKRSVGILLTGYFFQGVGTLMTFFYIGIYVIRVMTTGFMEGHQANGAFVACGPPGFTALAMLSLGEHSSHIFKYHPYEMIQNFGIVWQAGSVLCSLMLWGLAVFLFIFAVLPYPFKVHKHLKDVLGAWALTFPNVGWINTLSLFADIFDVRAFEHLHIVLTSLMVLVWTTLFILTLVAFWKGEILMSQDDEASMKEDSIPQSISDFFQTESCEEARIEEGRRGRSSSDSEGSDVEDRAGHYGAGAWSRRTSITLLPVASSSN